ncbi:MAG: DUF4919 domain-containing protein [Chitinophagaceae bacterium]
MRPIRPLILILLLVASTSIIAQSNYIPVNREYIEKKVKDSTSPFYYQTLLKRYLAYDSTLNLEDYRFLYFGYPFQPGYSPYADFKNSELNDLLKNKDTKKALALAKEVYHEQPVSPRSLYNMLVTLQISGSNDSTMRHVQRQYVNIIDAIVSSGDGKSCGTAFKTIFVPDQYEVMANYLNINQQGRVLEGTCDKFSVKPNLMFDQASLYFDTSETLRGLSELLKDGAPEKTGKKKKKNKSGS